MILYLGITAVTILLSAYYFFGFGKNNARPRGAKDVPEVKGNLPIVGHGIAFSRDIIGFVRNAYRNYGKIFKIKVFRSTFVVVCDNNLKKEFFKATEDKMSLYDVLDKLYFSDAFSDDPKKLALIINLVKKTISIRYDEFSPKIMDEASRMIKRMRKRSASETIRITDEMIRFVACTSARCFISVELTDEFYNVLMEFTVLLNRIVVLTYFFPKSILRMILNPKLRRLRKKMVALLDDEIEKYRKDKTKSDSLVFRTGVDYYDKEIGRHLTNEEIGDIIVCLLYVSSENTALGLSATITDLARHPKYWDMVKAESAKYLKSGDVKSLYASSILDACVMESARMNSHIFALNRKPINRDATIGGYYVGDVDCVAMCEPMLMNYDCAEENFKDAQQYNPDRFLSEKEKKTPYQVMTWGAGVHLCPGKQFAIMEIKAAMSLVTNNFERFEIGAKNYGELNYFSPSAFAEREVGVILKGLVNPINLSKGSMSTIVIQDKTYKVQYLAAGGWLLRDCLDREEQINFYRYTVKISSESEEHKELPFIEPEKPYPLAYHNLVYTGKSNCDRPDKWLEWGQELWKMLCEKQKDFPAHTRIFDSVYAQLYANESTMNVHKDEYVSWGISVNLGASCDFLFGEETMILNTGDVLVADFSKVDHAVTKIHADSKPGWFDDKYEDIKTFGRSRCSVQIRNVSECEPNKLITTEEFKNMINK